jgi:hypothetical protein
MKRSMMLLVLFGLMAATAAQAAPVITRALVSPERVQAGESVIFAAQAEDPEGPTDQLRVGVFFRTPNGEIQVLPLRYIPEYDAYMNSLDIPRGAPNGEYTLHVVAENAAGERSEPWNLTLTIYSAIDIRVVAPRGAFITPEMAAVKNFHRRDGEDGTETDGEREFMVRRHTVLRFHSMYEGVWYDEGAGFGGTQLALYMLASDGGWELIDEDRRVSFDLEGPAIRHGEETVTFPAIRPGEYTLKLAVTSAVIPAEGEPQEDHDELIFQVIVRD